MAWSMGTTNAWADRVDGEEEEAPAPPALPAFAAEESFPSLGEAAKVAPPTKKDKKKGGKPKAMSLADFNTGAYKAPVPAGGGGAYRAGAGYGRPKPNDDEILNMLPKGPSGYSQEDSSGGIGGGFKEYGGNRGGRSRSSLVLPTCADLLCSFLQCPRCTITGAHTLAALWAFDFASRPAAVGRLTARAGPVHPAIIGCCVH